MTSTAIIGPPFSGKSELFNRTFGWKTFIPSVRKPLYNVKLRGYRETFNKLGYNMIPKCSLNGKKDSLCAMYAAKDKSPHYQRRLIHTMNECKLQMLTENHAIESAEVKPDHIAEMLAVSHFLYEKRNMVSFVDQVYVPARVLQPHSIPIESLACEDINELAPMYRTFLNLYAPDAFVYTSDTYSKHFGLKTT